MADTPSRLVKWIQYSPVTGVIEITTSDFPDWITTYPDRGRQPRRYTAPSFFGPFIEPEQLVWPTVYPNKGRQLRRDIHTGATFVPDIVAVVVEEGSLVQLAEGRRLRRDIHAGPSIPGIFVAEQLVSHATYPDRVNRIRLSPSQQQFTTYDPNFSIVPAAVCDVPHFTILSSLNPEVNAIDTVRLSVS